MTKFKTIVCSVIGDIDQIGSERYFVTVTCFTVPVYQD